MIRRRNIEKTHRDTYVMNDYQASSVADKIIGIIPVKSELVSVQEVHVTAGNHASAVSLAVERLQGTETSSQGDQVATGINLKGTAATVQSATISEASNIHRFNAGDRVGINVTGDTQTLAGMVVTCYFRPID